MLAQGGNLEIFDEFGESLLFGGLRGLNGDSVEVGDRLAAAKCPGGCESGRADFRQGVAQFREDPVE